MEEPTPFEGPPGLRAGSRFGHYRLRRLLGRGGFGEVYEAQDTVMDRVVALKLLAAPYSQSQVFRQRLYREARAAGRLHEPHVVPIHQCGEIEGQLYIDMRLIEGTDLQSVLARDGPLSAARAVAIVRQIAAALDAAHAEQVIHRDVKPANILLSGDDFACLVDFGLATAATDAKLTSAGTMIGTFAYMAPERLSNADVGHRADIYALACVLYECLTGSPPYPTADRVALITAHLTAPVPRPSAQRPGIPAAFDQVIARGMAKAPKDRYASAGELARAAHEALSAPARHRDEATGSRTPTAAGSRGKAATTAKPPLSSPTKTQRASAKPARSPAKTDHPAAKPPTSSPARTQRTSPELLNAIMIPIVVLLVLVLIAVVIAVTVIVQREPRHPPAPPQPSARPSTAPATSTVMPEPATVTTPSPTTTRSVAPPLVPIPITTTSSAAPAVRTALPACYQHGPIDEKPTSSSTACRMHWYENLTWTSWGPNAADGTGIEQLQNCTPYCYNGQIFRNPVEVHFSSPEPPPPDSGCPSDVRYYTQLIVAYPSTPAPPQTAVVNPDTNEPVYTQYNGMPAYRWDSLTPNCKWP